MKNLIIFGALIFLLSAFATIHEESTIHEGEGVGNLLLEMKFEEANTILNSKYIKIKWVEYSYEYKYKKLGLSLWVKQSDKSNRIFSISVNPRKWNGKTEKGLVINEKLQIKHVISVYGKPEWSYTDDCTELEAEYDKIGIQFSVNTMKDICDEDSLNHDSLFFNEFVTEITIGKVGEGY